MFTKLNFCRVKAYCGTAVLIVIVIHCKENVFDGRARQKFD